MSAYLDASALLPIFLSDSFSARIDAYLRNMKPDLYVSDFAAAEFASALGVKIRMGQLTNREAEDSLLDFDAWQSSVPRVIDTLGRDIRAAEAILRRLDLGLRTPDALHIAITLRTQCDLLTFDDRMAAGARALGVSVASP